MLYDDVIPFCGAVVLSVGTLQVAIRKGALFTRCLVSSETGGGWFWVADMEGVRDVFAKRAAVTTVSCEASGFSEGPEVQGGGKQQVWREPTNRCWGAPWSSHEDLPTCHFRRPNWLGTVLVAAE